MFQGIFKSAIKMPDTNTSYIFGTGSIPIQIKSAQLATFADGTTKQQGYQVAEVNKLISTMLTGWDKDGNKPKSMSDNYLELILSCDNGFVVKKRLQFPHIIAWKDDSTPYNIANVYKQFSIDNWLKADDFENPDITLVVEPTDEILTTSTATPPEATTEQSGRFYLYYRNLPVGVNRVHIEFHIKTKTEPIDFDLEVIDGMSWKDAQTILASNDQAKINVLLNGVKDVYKFTGAESDFEDITMYQWSELYQQIISLKPSNKFTHDLYFYIYDESELNTKLTELDVKLIKLVGFGETGIGGGVTAIGDVYYNTSTKLLRKLISGTPYGGVYDTVPYYDGAIYTCGEKFYIWNGDDLVVPIASYSIFSGSSSVIMSPGVSSGNGNFWYLVGASLPSEIGGKYGNGFFSLELVEVGINDVLEINYTKMGIDRAKYKIGIIEYDENGKYFGIDGGAFNSEPTYYEQDSLVTFQERTKYIRFTVYRLDISTYELQTEFRLPIFFTKYSSNLVKLVKDFANNGSNITPSFPFVKPVTYPVINTNIVFNNTASLSYNGKSIGFNNGYVILPEEYTPYGKGLPLILFFHGTEGIDFVNANSPLYLDLLKNVAKGGYIVADCSSLSSFYYNNDEGITKTIVEANYPEPIAWECYHKLFLHITRRWNIDESHVYVFGKSAGGLNTIMLSQMGLLPIKAAANLAGSIDVITNMMVMASGPNNINPFLHRIGMKDANLSGQIAGTGDADYLVSHIQDLAGFNPLWFKTIGLDKETQIRRCIIDGLNTSAIENDTDLQNAVSLASTSLRIPIKWWHAIDDVNVPIATTRMYQKMVRNGGGVFEIREFPSGCGAHHAVDNDSNAPTTSYTHRNGVTVTLPVAYAEVLDWFNLWW